MKAETRKNPYLIVFLIVLIPIVAFIIYFTIMMMMSSSRKLKKISAEYGIARYEKQKLSENIISDSTFLSLFREKSYLQSLVSMAESDSVYLTINMKEKLINIEISGVVVHSTPIDAIEASKILTQGDDFVLTSLFSAPLTITNDTSSIAKIPIIFKVAPKDTSEFKPDAIPDTAFYQPVNYIFETDRGIKIFVYQSEEIKRGDTKDRFLFDLLHRLVQTKTALKDILAFKVPDYQPFIKIKIPSDEAKIIYRAIPRHGQIGIYR